MFKKQGSIKISKQDLSNYLEGFNLFNSALVTELKNPSIEKTTYLITKNEHRPDLIAKDIYGDEKYMGLLIFTCSIGLEDYKKGTVLEIIPKTVLDSILEKL